MIEDGLKLSELQHPDYEKYESIWQKVMDAIDGQDFIKMGGDTYLMRPECMDDCTYKYYLGRASFPEVISPLIDKVVGSVFRREMTVTGIDDIKSDLDVFDNHGLSFDNFAIDVMREVESLSRYGVVVNYDDDSGLIKACKYHANTILNWSSDTKGKLLSVTLYDNDGTIKHLYLDDGTYTIQTLSKRDDKDEYYQDGELQTPLVNGQTIDFIPFVFISPFGQTPEIYKPRHLALVNKSLEYYNLSADINNIIYYTGSPTFLFKIGDPQAYQAIQEALQKNKQPEKHNKKNDDTISLGAGKVNVTDKDSSLESVEISGAGLSQMINRLNDIVEEMGMLGANVASLQSGNVAEQTERIRQSSNTASIALVVQSVSQGLKRILEYVFKLKGMDIPDDLNVSLNKDFFDTPITIQDMIQLKMNGLISNKDIHNNLQSQGIVTSTYDESRELIEKDQEDEFSAELRSNRAFSEDGQRQDT